MSYITFIYSYCKQFGFLEIPVWNQLREWIFQLIPDIAKSKLMQLKYKKESTNVILESLKKEVNEEYVSKLMKVISKELLG